MSKLKELIHEIHRRSLWQVVGLYLGASWLVLQVIETLTDSVGLPAWVPSFAIVLLLIGFPIVLATAFVQEGIGGREGRSSETGGGAEAPSLPEADDPRPREVSRASPVAAEATRHRLFTWRNALLGGVGAFALLGLLTLGYMAMRTLGIGPAGTLVAKGLLEERATILVADFVSTDSTLARAATEALRVDLSQSRAVRVADAALIREGLARMELPPDAGLGLERARQLAQREGVPAVVGGEINPAGDGYVLTASLVGVESGEILTPVHERLGELHHGAGNLQQAAEHYARFVELWQDADPELQPRVRAAQQRLEAIVAERG